VGGSIHTLGEGLTYEAGGAADSRCLRLSCWSCLGLIRSMSRDPFGSGQSCEVTVRGRRRLGYNDWLRQQIRIISVARPMMTPDELNALIADWQLRRAGLVKNRRRGNVTAATLTRSGRPEWQAHDRSCAGA
jgi:hypothetical protein